MIKTSIKKFKQETSLINAVAHDPVPSELQETTEPDEILQEIYRLEKRYMPFIKLSMIFVVFILVGLASFIRGSSSYESIAGLKICSDEYWGVSAIIVIFLLILYLLCALLNMKNYRYKLEHGYDFDSSDIRWSIGNCGILGIAGFAVGFIGSIIGIGGAMIINPVLIRKNVKPEIMTALTTSMIVFTLSISTLQYAIAGKINLDYALWTSGFSFVGAIVGVFVIKIIFERYKRSSIILMALAAALVIPAFTTAIYGIYISVHGTTDYGFHSYC